MADSITFQFEYLPESVNHLYVVRGGRKVLSTAGREYRNRFIATGGGVSKAKLMAFEADEELPYKLEVLFLLPYDQLYNINYGRDKRVKSPFSDIDATNMIKLPEDCIAKLLGIRDRNNFTVVLHKRESPDGNPRLIARISRLDPLHLDDVLQDFME